ncbi:MAG TPA: DNA (cytosine-5-)-methyltransferase [Saprospiraceae bacterium]|nr:DNA (cytosine-5-)-methyltransferase [Saprospiraceae bacterium]
MWNKNEIKYFRTVLLEWFASNKREFPWRKDGVSSYELIFSEILLQRTKAETVAKYYDYFFNKFPDWDRLVLATDKELEEIFKLFGLHTQRVGRVRKIIEEYELKNGVLPKNKDELQDSSLASLYISNAYELFILKNKAALLDVNMSRVLSRFFYPKKFKDIRYDKIIQDLAHNVINVKACKELNWAILDYAALVCKQQKPKCQDCKLSSKCRFFELSKNTKDSIEDIQTSIKYDSEIHMNPDKPLKLVSLFSGCGGMDLGFEGDFIVHKDSVNEKLNPDFISERLEEDFVRLKPTKFQTVFANDILMEARNAWVNYFKNRNYSSEVYHVESIVDLVKAHREGYKVFPEQVDIVTGGFPCQDFSIAGKRNGFDSFKDHTGKNREDIPSLETRGQLYIWMKEVIELTQPKIFIAENVKGLVNLSNVKDIIQKDFSAINGNGYLVLDPIVLHAADYGVPQSRERVIFIGIKKSELNPTALKELSQEKIKEKYYPYPKPTHSYNTSGKDLKDPVKLGIIFKNLLEPEFTNDPSQKYYSKAKFMGKHCQGQTEVNMQGIGPTIRAEHHGNIEFRRLAIENGGKQFNELKNNLNERRLTPRECAMIQTFPPDYEFVIPLNNSRFFISASAAYKIIGNAVPPLLAYHLANRIQSLWDLYFKQESNGNIIKPRTRQPGISIID